MVFFLDRQNDIFPFFGLNRGYDVQFNNFGIFCQLNLFRFYILCSQFCNNIFLSKNKLCNLFTFQYLHRDSYPFTFFLLRWICIRLPPYMTLILHINLLFVYISSSEIGVKDATLLQISRANQPIEIQFQINMINSGGWSFNSWFCYSVLPNISLVFQSNLLFGCAYRCGILCITCYFIFNYHVLAWLGIIQDFNLIELFSVLELSIAFHLDFHRLSFHVLLCDSCQFFPLLSLSRGHAIWLAVRTGYINKDHVWFYSLKRGECACSFIFTSAEGIFLSSIGGGSSASNYKRWYD